MIENIAVAPGRQGQGRGRALLGWAEVQAAAHGYAEVRLYTHETMVENLAFYRRHGFEVTRAAADDPYGRGAHAQGLWQHLTGPDRRLRTLQEGRQVDRAHAPLDWAKVPGSRSGSTRWGSD
ncbi:GNAT family N-acetyltransferase [Mumia sp. zg.B17]|uniref:GNAT family N-acetyltransferase n=1 Tax=Mumia sp. zg.B17 TaxID=2855446 RepID=UPI001C6E67B6|nr:GNAT family N-acetyltransferase [Mumia sp. zg.B17]